MKNLFLALLVGCVLLGAFAAPGSAKTKVILLDGESGGAYHAWQETTPYLKRMLDETGLFDVEVITAPQAGGDFANFKPNWKSAKVIVSNYDVPDERWSDELKASFEEYIRNGGGLVSVHAADNAFPKWKEYNLMIGVGGWRGRNEKDGPMFYWKDGKVMEDTWPGNAGAHGARLPFQIVTRVPNHPIMKGLPPVWMHVADELYAKMRGPGQNMTVLATGFSDPANRGTGRDEPILMALTYGKGRIFHTVLGHDLAALNSVGFIVTYQRGTEWAATGKVTQKVPKDFPTADKPATRKEYEPPAGWTSPGGRPRTGGPKPAAPKP
jgi:type 1 glutamine amidotransferase